MGYDPSADFKADPYGFTGMIGGGVLGAMAGTALGPAGTVAGGAAGAYGGRQAGRYLGQQFDPNNQYGGKTPANQPMWGDGNNLAEKVGFDATQAGPFGMPGYTTQATQAAGPDMAAQLAARAQEEEMIRQLRARALGLSPSLAALQAQQMGERTNANFLGAVAGARGMAPGLALRTFGMQAGQNAQAAGMNAAQARLAEMQGASGQWANALGAQRGSDLNAAQLAAQAAQFNAGQQNTFAGQRNAHVYGLEQQRQQHNLQLRDDFAKALANAAAQAGGQAAGFGGLGGGGGGGAMPTGVVTSPSPTY